MNTTIVRIMASLAIVILLAACDKADNEPTLVSDAPNDQIQMLVIPAEQQAGEAVFSDANKALCESLTSGIRLNFQMEGITQIVVESVDKNDIAGIGNLKTANGETVIADISEGQSIITYRAPEGTTLQTGQDYIITTFPCDLYGGYRLSIYKDGKVAHYFSVHQVTEAGKYITPLDLDESELEFGDPDAPLVEEERPGLNTQTKSALVAYQKNPTEENKHALLEQMGIRYDKVVARKKAKLRELEREAKHQSLVDEMQAIVDEMVENREIRLEQQFLRLIDPRNDDDPNDAWCVLRGANGNNPYIGYAPVTNAEYKAFKPDYNYAAGQNSYPVVNITYADAVAYCEWLGTSDSQHLYRLPSEEDWILGAGHMPKDVSMNSDHVEKGLTAVDAYKQTTGACGGIDFWGNCWEWTSTQTAGGQYIVKGGAWGTSRDECRSEYSDTAYDGSKGYANVGFRVVRIDK